MIPTPDLRALLAAAERADKHCPGPWELQDGCSWRRIGARSDGDVVCPTNHPHDRHPDLLAKPGVLEYIAKADPTTVKALCTELLELKERLGVCKLCNVTVLLPKDYVPEQFEEAT